MQPPRSLQYIPLQTQQGISAPSEHSGDLQKHTVAYGQKRKDMGTATVENTAGKT